MQFTEANNNDLHLSSGSEKESFKPLLDGVAEWEIPWEDLQIGERIGLGKISFFPYFTIHYLWISLPIY